MEHNNKKWAKIILTAYKSIDRVNKSIDESMKVMAMTGFSSKLGYTSSEFLLDKMINALYRKQGIMNLKAIANEVLVELSDYNKKILFYRYINKLTFEEIGKKFDISLRTSFRHHDKALEIFDKILKEKGFSDEFLSNEYSHDIFIVAIENTLKDDLDIIR